MILIRKILRWILSVIIIIAVFFCIAYALGLFTQEGVEEFFSKIKFVFI